MRSPIGWVESVPPQDAGTHRDDTHTNTRDSGLCSSQNSPFFLVEMLWRDDLLAAAAGKGWGYCCCCRGRLVVIAKRVTTMMLVPAVQALALSLRFSGGGGVGEYGFVKGQMTWNSFQTREQFWWFSVGFGGMEEERGPGDRLSWGLS